MMLFRKLMFAGGYLTFLLVIGLSSQTTFARQDDPLRKLQREYTASILPILRKQCLDCHSGDQADAGLDLSGYREIGEILKARKRWKKVEHRVAAREMPPAEDWGELDESDYQTLMNWLDQLLNTADCSDPDPGRVTLRRLNRYEYRNTVRDLTGVDYPESMDFPGDDVGYGFDNIADVISLPPILLEKYLKAAEHISEQIVVDPRKPLLVQSLSFSDFSNPRGTRMAESNLVFYSNATASAPVTLPADGRYRVTVTVIPEQAGGDPVKISARFRRGRTVEKPVTERTDQLAEIEFLLNGRAGENRIEISFLNDYYFEGNEERPREDRNIYLVSLLLEGPLPNNRPAAGNPLSLISAEIPATAAEQLELARQIIQDFGSRAFRRPITEAELERILSFFQQLQSTDDNVGDVEGDDFEGALRYAVQAILVSPHFLFKVEEPNRPGVVRSLNSYELASSLSYFLWSSMPDEQLFGLAAQGALNEPAVLQEQVRRMLADPRSSALVDQFVAQWLQLVKLETMEPDPELFPGVDLLLRREMIEETKQVVAELIRQDASVLTLLDTDFTFVTPRLARFYGLENRMEQTPANDQFVRISTRDTPRIGLLTHASILMVTSNPDRTSPVKRGKWVMENLLGDEPPPADPAAMPIEDQPELTGTLRQRMEQHRADPGCASCHKVMDELGFALENFDAVGRWREQDQGLPIDASGLLPDGSTFAGAFEMQQTIKTRRQTDFTRCLTEKMLIYATGRGMEYFDECALDTIMEQLQAKESRFSELILLVAGSDPFTKRRGHKEEITAEQE
jgi:hypothetical protein